MTAEVKAKPSLFDGLQDKVFSYMAIAFLVLLPVEEIFFEILRKFKVGSFKKFTPTKHHAYIIAGFAILLLLAIIASFVLRIMKEGLKIYVADIFFCTLTVFMLLSMFFSVNFGVFAGGSQYNCEWPLHFMCYYGLFYAGSMIKDSELRKKILLAYVLIAVIEGIVAFFQTFDLELAYCLFREDRVSKTTFGTVQNTNFFGTFSCILTAASAGMFIFSSKISKSKIFKWAMFAISLLIF